MSFEDQTYRRKLQIFRNAMRFQEIASGVFVQRIPARYLGRLLSGEDDDPVVKTLQRLDDIFAQCKAKKVDMASSVEAILDEYDTDRKCGGAVLLAWSMRFDAAQQVMQTPELVGLATVSSFRFSSNFTTDEQSLSPPDAQRLRPYRNWMYIDALCSLRPGVGRLLVLHAYHYAIAQKRPGLIALAFSARERDVPESHRIFSKLGFEAIIPRANFQVRLYGTWFAKPTSEIGLAGMAEGAVRVCTRTGFTEKTADTLIWRCP